MKYQFSHIVDGQIAEGYTVLNINGGEAWCDTPDKKALAEKHGGRPVPAKTKQEGPKGAPKQGDKGE